MLVHALGGGSCGGGRVSSEAIASTAVTSLNWTWDGGVVDASAGITKGMPKGLVLDEGIGKAEKG